MPTVYRDTDPSAPILTGTVGALTALLDACLVNGYGSKSAAGWTKPYTSTNAVVYLQGGSAPNRYFQVDDNGPGAGGAKEARLYPFETMTAYNTGTGTMSAGGSIVAASTFTVLRKSTTADSTPRQWVLFADTKTVYLFVMAGDFANVYYGYWFGDFYSFKSGDNFKYGILSRVSENNATALNGDLFVVGYAGALNTVNLARASTGVAGSIVGSQTGDATLEANGNNFGPLTGNLQYPHGPDGGFYLCPLYLNEGGVNITVIRGKHRGAWHCVHASSYFTDGNVINGTGPYAGRTFMIVKPSATSGSATPIAGYLAVETTAWPTST